MRVPYDRKFSILFLRCLERYFTQAKLSEFEIAKKRVRTSPLTRSDMVRKYGFMSPREVAQCHKGLMGGMSDVERESVTHSAEA